jgi:hypothetical protein
VDFDALVEAAARAMGDVGSVAEVKRAINELEERYEQDVRDRAVTEEVLARTCSL